MEIADSIQTAGEGIIVPDAYNWEGLRVQYQKELKNHQKGATAKVVMIVLALLYGIIIAPQIVKNSRTQLYLNERTEGQLYYQDGISVKGNDPIFNDDGLRSSIDSANSIVTLVCIASAVMLLLYFYNVRKTPLNEGNYLLLARNDFKPIWSFIDQAMGKMELFGYDIQIYYLKTSSLEANVSLNGQTISLYLSRGFISLFSTNQNYFKAILFHELGHVLQRDRKSLQVNNRVFWFPAVLFVIAFIISITHDGYFKSYVGMFGIILINFFQLFYKRRNAELLADTASMVYSENVAIKEVVEKIVSSKPSIWYPTKPERLVNINQRLNSYKL